MLDTPFYNAAEVVGGSELVFAPGGSETISHRQTVLCEGGSGCTLYQTFACVCTSSSDIASE
jgi:hypothetical protein